MGEKVPTIEKIILVDGLKNEKPIRKTIKVAGPDLALYSDDQLYKWVKECFSAENERAKNDKVPVYGLEFNVDWQYEWFTLVEKRTRASAISLYGRKTSGDGH